MPFKPSFHNNFYRSQRHHHLPGHPRLKPGKLSSLHSSPCCIQSIIKSNEVHLQEIYLVCPSNHSNNHYQILGQRLKNVTSGPNSTHRTFCLTCMKLFLKCEYLPVLKIEISHTHKNRFPAFLGISEDLKKPG